MTARPPVAALAVATLLVVAGCSGFGGGGTPDRQPYDVPPPTPSPTETVTETATRTPVPTTTVVPGIARTGVKSALDSMRSHGLALLNESFEVSRTVTVQYANGTVLKQTELRAYVGRQREEYFATEVGEDGDRLSVFADGQIALSRLERSTGTEYEVVTPPGGRIPDPGGVLGTDLTFTSRIYLYVSGMNDVEVSKLTDSKNGTDRYQIASNDVDSQSIDTITRGSVSNVSVVIVATENGLVESVWGIYTKERDGQVFQVFERIKYDNVGRTTVPVPEWVEEARNATDDGRGRLTRR